VAPYIESEDFMKWSIRIGSLFGIPVYIHVTFLLFLVWIGVLGWREAHSLTAAIQGIAFVVSIFACVVLHELGHALTARRYGIPTRDITLLPIGGVARLERMPDDPRQELWVALAGPAVNVVIAGVIFVILKAPASLATLEGISVTGGSILARIMAVNIFLVVFNLLPAFPMDGGRVLRALLATRMNYASATRIAAMIGQTMAFLFGFAGLFINPMLIFIALFVWIGAAQEANMVRMRFSLAGVPVSRAMVTDFRAVRPDDTLEQAVHLTLAGTQRDFPVIDGDRVVGILTHRDLIAALGQGGTAVPVRAVMQAEFETMDASEMLADAFQRMSASRCGTAPVTHDGRLVGLVTLDNIGELLAIRGALARVRRAD
jgi:Zn-dependent protease/CBS domain-containing protein